MGFAGRFLNDNHLGYIALTIAIGYILLQEEKPDSGNANMAPSSP